MDAALVLRKGQNPHFVQYFIRGAGAGGRANLAEAASSSPPIIPSASPLLSFSIPFLRSLRGFYS
jgi:hypothetical protein